MRIAFTHVNNAKESKQPYVPFRFARLRNPLFIGSSRLSRPTIRILASRNGCFPTFCHACPGGTKRCIPSLCPRSCCQAAIPTARRSVLRRESLKVRTNLPALLLTHLFFSRWVPTLALWGAGAGGAVTLFLSSVPLFQNDVLKSIPVVSSYFQGKLCMVSCDDTDSLIF